MVANAVDFFAMAPSQYVHRVRLSIITERYGVSKARS